MNNVICEEHEDVLVSERGALHPRWLFVVSHNFFELVAGRADSIWNPHNPPPIIELPLQPCLPRSNQEM